MHSVYFGEKPLPCFQHFLFRNVRGDSPWSRLNSAEKVSALSYPVCEAISLMDNYGVQKQVYGQTHPQVVMMLLGVNAIRFHKFDMVTRARRLILDLNSESGEFSKENQEHFEYFIAKLKENGIDLVMDLQTIRVIGAEECPPLARERYNTYGMFVPELIEAQKRFITLLLTHRNPFTGLTLAEDHALALIIFHNENSMLYQPNRNRITFPYALKILKDRLNGYLLLRYGKRNALEKAWKTLGESENPASGSVELPMNPSGKNYSHCRLADMRLFYYEIQKAYYREIRTHLKNSASGCQ